MKIWLRVFAGLLMMLTALFLVSCTGAPGCPQATFGGTACTPGGGTTFGPPPGGGGGNPTATAFVYAVDQQGGTSGQGANGTIDGYDLSVSGSSFAPLSGFTAPSIPANEAGEAMVVVNKKFVYAVFEVSGQLYGWSLDGSSGDLTTLTGFPMSVILNLPVGVTGQYQMTSDPGGNFLFISSSGGNAIFVYAINSTTGALTAVPGSPFSTVGAGIEPGNIATDGLGRFLYVCVASGGGGTDFVGYTIGANGALTLIPGGLFTANVWELQGDATGRYLVGTSGNSIGSTGRDDNHLYVYSINQTTGVATAVGTPVSTTYSPLRIAMQPPSSNGEYVYTFGINDTNTGFNPIEGYQLNTSTGALTAIMGSPFSNIFLGQWGQFDQSGANLVVYADVLTQSGYVAQLGALSVDSNGALTQPISPVTLVTPGWWVVTDP